MNRSSDIGKSIHLSASAGSGKTRALKERYLALLDVLDRRDMNIDQAVAITFTDKAAAEIRERVMHDLHEPMLKKIIRGRQDLRISTIHSFCMNLLKRYPLEAGLPPDFGILDGRDQAGKTRKAIEDALEKNDRDPDIMSAFADFTADQLIECLEFMVSIRSRLKRLEIDAGGPGGFLRELRKGANIDESERELQELVSSRAWRSTLAEMELFLRRQPLYYEACRGAEHLRLAAIEDREQAAVSVDSLASLYFIRDGSPAKRCSIPKSRYLGGDRTEYERTYYAVQELLGRFRSTSARLRSGREAICLFRLYEACERNYRSAKLREGVLDFDDLEIYAYGLLQGIESPDILYWLDRKILHFLVDEFQDTSDIQWAILNRLTEEIFAGQGAEKRMQPTLFVVGDEKQSIYRFREANYRLIETIRQRMQDRIPASSREILSLDKNFRSTPEIISTVNDLFGALWGNAYQPSKAERTGHAGSVTLIELAAQGTDGGGARSEAQVLAREIRSLVTAGTMVHEKSAGTNAAIGWKQRPAGYGDCAILIQSRTMLKEYEAALQELTIPYRVVGGIGFYEEDEIQALMHVLFFLWNADDSLALAAALKSSLFGLDDRQIHELMQGEGNVLERLIRLHPAEGKLVREWKDLAGLVPLARLVHRIMQDTAASVRFGRSNPQAVFNLEKLLDTAREFDRRGYTTLQDFVTWVRNIRRTEQREATADVNLPGFEGTVSIMTVHKAKGLEYPVLFLPGMNQQPWSVSSGPPVLVEEGNGSVRMAIKDSASPAYKEMWDREQAELLREHQRLLYVAMTRARDHLVMIGRHAGTGKAVKQNSWLSYLHLAAPASLFGNRIATDGSTICRYPPSRSIPEAKQPASLSGQAEADKPAPLLVDVELLARNLAPLARSDSPEWKRATDLLDPGDVRISYPVPEPGAVPPLLKGTILHRCLEQLTKSGSYDLGAVAAEYTDLNAFAPGRFEQFLQDSRTLLERVLKDPANRWIFDRAERSWSELPFLHKKGSTLMSGVIDRVIIRGDEGSIIDYKAIMITDEQAHAAWLAHYRPQVQAYCEAVKEIFGLRSVKGYLLFLDSNMLSPCVTI